MSERILEVNDLRVSFFTQVGEVKAVNGISYHLDKGEVLGIVGESGSGKSVSAYSLIGLISDPGRVIGGSITFDGRDVLKMTKEETRLLRGREIAMIFQDPMTCLNPLYTIGNQIKEALALYFNMKGKEADLRAEELLNLVGINDPKRRLKQYPFEFSGGMRQRAMIAMALAGDPKLLIADEPTTALDVTIQAQILELLKEIKSRINMSVILITHDLGIVADFADRVVTMYGGKIVEAGPTSVIFKKPSHPYTKGLLGSLPSIASDGGRLNSIEGSPVDLLNPPKGCPFAPRCSKCMKVCLDNMPPVFELGDGHGSACWLNHDFAEKEGVNA